MGTANILVCCLCLVGTALAVDWNVTTVLDQYVNANENIFRYIVDRTRFTDEHTIVILRVETLEWRDERSDTEFWVHYVGMVIPHTVDREDIMYVRLDSGEKDDDPPDDEKLETIIRIARNSGTVAVQIFGIPNQPITFLEEPFTRTGDEILGFTWKRYLVQTVAPPPRGLLQFPMVKAAKLAVDAVINAASTEFNLTITNYMVSGVSRQAWAAGLLACVDRRVSALGIQKFNHINFKEVMNHHYMSLGGWSYALVGLWEEQVMAHLLDERMDEILSHVDINNYRERLTMPKMFQVGGNDEHYLIDGVNHWYSGMTEPKYLAIFDNEAHLPDETNEEMEQQLEAFYIGIVDDFTFPRLNWTLTADNDRGSVELYSNVQPNDVTAWRADTRGIIYRDFRENRIGGENNDIEWHDEPLERRANGTYYIQYDTFEGYRGFYIKADVPGPRGRVLWWTSEVNIIPDTYPYPRCSTVSQCMGVLM